MLYPVTWAEAPDDKWDLVVRCPNCEWSARELWDHEKIEEFDTILNRGTDALIDDLERITRENFSDYTDRFVSALDSDSLLPEDF